MTAVLFRLRAELRSRWRSIVALTLLSGIGGGVVLAALAGAVRTESAYPRFLANTRAFDAVLSAQVSDDVPDAQQIAMLEPVRKYPSVLDSSLVDLFTAQLVGPTGRTALFPDVFPLADDNGHFGTTLNRIKLISGRRADPARVDEAVASPVVASRLGVKTGQRIELRFVQEDGPPRVESVTVVGIGVMAGQVDPSGAGFIPSVLMTPAFFAAHEAPADRGGPVIALRIRGGQRGLRALIAKARAQGTLLAPDISQLPQTLSLERSARFDIIGLRLFAALAGLAVLAIFGQLLVRQIFLDSDDHAKLRSLGMTGRHLALLGLLRTAIVALAAACIAIGLAIALSPLAPIGPARTFELSPGVHVDVRLLAIGALAIMALILLVGVIPATRSSRRAAAQASPRSVGAADALARTSLPPSAVVGVRMALEPGRGTTAVPVRTTIFGTAVAVAVFMMALTFGGSLNHLVATPRLSGWNYDAIVGLEPDIVDGIEKRLIAGGAVGAIARGDIPDIFIGKLHLAAFAFDRGTIGPTVISGRAPEGPSEIALGRRSAETLGAKIGDKVRITFLTDEVDTPASRRAVDLRVVGYVVLPQFFFSVQGGGHGAAISSDVIRANGGPALRGTLIVRFPRGMSVDEGIRRVHEAVGANDSFIVPRSQARDLTNLSRVSNLPRILGALLGLLAAGTLAHTLISSVRRRRRDLAILKTMGFVRGQVRMAVAWQSTTIVVIALAVGVPVGVIAGRWAWTAFINQLGYAPQPIVPLLQVLLAIPVTIVLANLIAGLPARSASRTQPAVALRSE